MMSKKMMEQGYVDKKNAGKALKIETQIVPLTTSIKALAFVLRKEHS